MKEKIQFVSPEILFCEPYPTANVGRPGNYYDKTEIGMSNYLQILPSIALYGIQYVVFINSSNRVLDGDFRVLAARELGITVPITVQKNMHYYNIWILRVIRRFRLLFKRNYLFFKKINADKSSCKRINKKSLIFSFQINIFEKYAKRVNKKRN